MKNLSDCRVLIVDDAKANLDILRDTIRANIAFGMARSDLRDGLRADMKRYSGK